MGLYRSRRIDSIQLWDGTHFRRCRRERLRIVEFAAQVNYNGLHYVPKQPPEATEEGMRQRILSCVGGAAVVLSAVAAWAEAYPPQVGQPHPDFTLPNIEGRAPVSLASYRGRKLLLIQFASW